MTAKKMVVLGYEDVGLKLLDTTSMRVTSHFGKPMFTDDVLCMYSDGEYIWVSDYDSTLSLYTADLVLVETIDYGYDSVVMNRSPKAFHINGDYLYILTSRRYGNVIEQSTKNQLCIRKFNKMNLIQISEVYINDIDLWDGTSHTCNTNNVKWTSTHIWLQSNVSMSHWKKINIDTGSISDTWDNGPLVDIIKIKNDDTYNLGDIALFGDLNNLTSNLDVVNFTNKTIQNITYDIVAASVAIGGMFDQVSIYADGFNTGNFKEIIKYNSSDNSLTGIIKWQLSDSVIQITDPNYLKLALVTINLNDGSVVFSSPVSFENILTHDCLANTPEMKYFNSVQYWVWLDGNRWLVGDNYDGFASVDFDTGTITVTGESFMHGYTSDGPYISSILTTTFNKTNISGFVTQSNSPVSGRKVYLYDKLTGEKIDSGATNGAGSYTLSKLTSRKTFVVAESASDTENYKVNAHL